MKVEIEPLGLMTPRIRDVPGIGISHTFAYEDIGVRMAERIEQEIAALRSAGRIVLSFETEKVINGVSYRLTCNMQKVEDTWRPWWTGRRRDGGGMTDKARQKLNEDAPLNAAIVAWVENNIDAVRTEAIQEYRNSIMTLVQAVRANCDALAFAATSPEERERNEKIRSLARAHAREGVVEIDEGALVSEGDDNGAYVAAWVWADFASTDLDKDNQCSECGGQMTLDGYNDLCAAWAAWAEETA